MELGTQKTVVCKAHRWHDRENEEGLRECRMPWDNKANRECVVRSSQ